MTAQHPVPINVSRATGVTARGVRADQQAVVVVLDRTRLLLRRDNGLALSLGPGPVADGRATSRHRPLRGQGSGIAAAGPSRRQRR
jgi:hypothetical protein